MLNGFPSILVIHPQYPARLVGYIGTPIMLYTGLNPKNSHMAYKGLYPKPPGCGYPRWYLPNHINMLLMWI